MSKSQELVEVVEVIDGFVHVNGKKTPFRNEFGYNIFKHKYQHEKCKTWEELSETLVTEVCDRYMPKDEVERLVKYVSEMKFIPAGRYLYYAGRLKRYYNNCYLLKVEEDTKEEWSELSKRAEACLLTGGGIGIDYSAIRAKGQKIKGSGGVASGPISKMHMINEIGRQVMQGGGRRSAIYGSLNWKHPDAKEFLTCKDWDSMPITGAYTEDGKPMTYGDAKKKNFEFACPMDMTNISINYDNDFLNKIYNKKVKKSDLINSHILPIEHLDFKIDEDDIFYKNCYYACKNGEPGFSFNFFEKEEETLRNACTEVTSEDDSDVCNLGSINMSRIKELWEFMDVIYLSSRFLVCGTMEADLPYAKIAKVREKNRRLGLGLMGIHEWLLQRGYKYEVTKELKKWLTQYKNISKSAADSLCLELGISCPVAYRAIAPTGTIGILAGTTTGIEPIYAVAYKRRFITEGNVYKYQYVIDATAKYLISIGIDHNKIETAIDLAKDPERRIAFQADIQDYVDMSISSTINLPSWGSEYNNEKTVHRFAHILAKYAHRLRGFTCYPDGARGGQPLESVPYELAVSMGSNIYEEAFDICDISKGGTCGS